MARMQAAIVAEQDLVVHRLLIDIHDNDGKTDVCRKWAIPGAVSPKPAGVWNWLGVERLQTLYFVPNLVYLVKHGVGSKML